MKLTKVHEDKRRSINVIDGLLEDDKEFSIISLNKGKAIGGCMHKKKENFFVVKGKVFCKIGDLEMTLPEGNGGDIPANKPHMFYAMKEDCIIVEWGISAEAKQKDGKDFKMKEMVDKINGN